MAYGSMTLDGKRYMLVPEAEFDTLLQQTRGVPELPPAAADGTMDAIRFGEAALARNIVARREAVGLTHRALADAAGIRVEQLNRAERGAAVLSTQMLAKIDAALAKVGVGGSGLHV